MMANHRKWLASAQDAPRSRHARPAHRSWLPLAVSLIAFVLVLGAWACTAVAQDAADEAKLYEAAKSEGAIVWYVGGPLEGMNAIAAEFQKQYPGLKVQTLRLVGVAQYQRFMDETGAKKYIADVLQNTDYPSMVSLVDDGHIAEWKIPTFDRVPEQFRIKDFAYAEYSSTSAIIYNVNKVTPEEAKLLETGWEAALDPRFKGRFSVSAMKCGVCYAPIHLFLDPKYKDRYGPDFLKQLAAGQGASYSEVLVAIDRVIAGEHDFTLWGWDGAGSVKLLEGAPIRWVYPRPTPRFGNSWLGISKYAPHPNASRLFLDWLMGDKGAMAMERVYGAETTLSGVPDQRAYTKEPWYHPPVEVYDIDWHRWDANYHKDMDLWATALKQAR
jgi:iron(III) transport system substrate-binding protein